jgi:hypothetical protein
LTWHHIVGAIFSSRWKSKLLRIANLVPGGIQSCVVLEKRQHHSSFLENWSCSPFRFPEQHGGVGIPMNHTTTTFAHLQGTVKYTKQSIFSDRQAHRSPLTWPSLALSKILRTCISSRSAAHNHHKEGEELGHVALRSHDRAKELYYKR